MSKKFPLFDIINVVRQPQIKIKKWEFVMKDKNSLAHNGWDCKYHIVFATKYKRMEIYGKTKKVIKNQTIKFVVKPC